MKVMVAFATVEGQTEKIAGFVADEVRNAGHEVSLEKVSDEGHVPSFEDFDRVILAASVHERRHPKPFEVLLAGQKEALAKTRSLFISVSLKAAFEDGLEEAQDFVDEMKMRTGFQPNHELLAAGAVKSGSYDYFQSQVVKHVLLDGRGIDTSEGDREFTDWPQISSATQNFLKH